MVRDFGTAMTQQISSSREMSFRKLFWIYMQSRSTSTCREVQMALDDDRDENGPDNRLS